MITVVMMTGVTLRVIAVRFGRPRRFSANGGSARAARRDVTEHIMADIAALLP